MQTVVIQLPRAGARREGGEATFLVTQLSGQFEINQQCVKGHGR